MIAPAEERGKAAVPIRAELHLHLEGAIDVDTLDSNGARHGLPPLPPGVLGISDWADGERAFGLVLARLRDAKDWFAATRALFCRMAAEDIAYAEASIMPFVHEEFGVPFADLWAGVADGLAAGAAETGLTLRLLFAIPRNAGAEAGYATLRMLERAAHPAVIGIDLAGEERPGTIAPFATAFDEARRMGLATAAHAGEFGGPERVAETLDLLAPQRIHHGIAAVRDPGLLRELAQRDIGLDVTPSANVAFGAVTALAEVPIAAMLAARLRVSVSTDDPALVGTTLPREHALLRSAFGLTEELAAEVEANAFRNAFDRAAVATMAPG